MNEVLLQAPPLMHRLRRWFAVLGVLLLSVLTVGCGAASDTGAGSASPAAGTATATGNVETPESIQVEARLIFPQRTELTFERAGEVAEIMVAPGERVSEGQTLARLNTDHFPALDEEVARLNQQIADAREAIKLLNLDYSGEPLLAAQREETAARLTLANTQAQDFFDDIDSNYEDLVTITMSERDRAEAALVLANDDLADAEADLSSDHALVIAAAEQGKKDAALALELALDRLSEYKDGLSDDAVRASDRVTRVEASLDRARENLEDYQDSFEQNTVRARDRVTESELALELAQDALENFLEEHDRQIIRVRNRVGSAEETLDFAEDRLTDFLRSPTRDLQADGKPVDVARLERLQAAVDLANSNLTQAQDDLAELVAGPDAFRVQELESNISVAELNLDQARDDLTELEEGPDPILQGELESNITVAELNLDQARDDLSELEEGPDILVLNQLQTQVDAARVNLNSANDRLEKALEGPDSLILPSLKLAVVLAERNLKLANRKYQKILEDGPDRKSVPLMELEIDSRLAQIDELYAGPDEAQLAQIQHLNAVIELSLDRIGDIAEEKEEFLLHAPADGVIYLVNMEEDDRVSKHSRVIELVDPGEAVIEGFIDAGEVQYVAPGSAVRIRLDSMPGQELTGTVAAVGAVPRTERGIINYPVTITLGLAEGVTVPFQMSAVDAAIIP